MKKYILSQLFVIFLFNTTVLAQKKPDSTKVPVDSVALKAKKALLEQELKEIETFIQVLGELKQKDYETLYDPKRVMREFYNWKLMQSK